MDRNREIMSHQQGLRAIATGSGGLRRTIKAKSLAA
jgi:hypothetical protein